MFASLNVQCTHLYSSSSFPDIDYFRSPDVQLQLTNILFLYSQTHTTIGYRQGMHELLAPLFYAVDWDSVPDNTFLQSEMNEFCSRDWVAADSWVLFDAVMRGVGQWYEWRETPPALPSATTSPLHGHIQLDLPNDQFDTTPYVTPVVKVCNRIQSTLLKNIDPILWKSVHDAGIEPQIYGMCVL